MKTLTLWIFVVTHLSVSLYGRRDITSVRPVTSTDTPSIEYAIPHRPLSQSYGEKLVQWSFHILPFENAEDITPTGIVLGYEYEYVTGLFYYTWYRWRPDGSVQRLSATEDTGIERPPPPSGFGNFLSASASSSAKMNRIGDVVCDFKFRVNTTINGEVDMYSASFTHFWPSGGGSSLVPPPPRLFSSYLGPVAGVCSRPVTLSHQEHSGVSLDDLGYVTVYQHTSLSPSIDASGCSVPAPVITPLGFPMKGRGPLVLDVDVAGTAVPGFQKLDDNTWGVVLSNHGVHFPGGVIEPLPQNGTVSGIDEEGRPRGRYHDVQRGNVSAVWTASRDEQGNFVAYEREDYEAVELPDGWTTSLKIAPGESAAKLGSASRAGETVEFALIPTFHRIDLDVDSDNDGVLVRSAEEEEAEAPDPLTPDASKPGKMIFVNNGDADADGVPNFADGLDIYTEDGAREAADSASFARMVVELPDISDLRVRFQYEPSDPAGVLRTGDQNSGYLYEPAPGQLRIWTKDGDELRQVGNVADGGDFVDTSVLYTREELGFSNGEVEKTFYIEAINPSVEVASDRIAMEVWLEAPANESVLPDSADEVAFTSALLTPLVPDYDRDGRIDESDLVLAQLGEPFYFWINDDDDKDAIDGNNIPESFPSGFSSDTDNPNPGGKRPATPASDNPDYSNDVVDGMRDLEDFFPLTVNIGDLLDGADLSKVKAKLSGLEVNLIDPDELAQIGMENSGDYLRKIAVANDLKDKAVIKVTDQPLELPASFLQNLADQDGVALLLLEGAKKTEGIKTLTLAFERDGDLWREFTVRLQVSPVEDMFKHINLTQYADASETRTGLPDRSTTPGWILNKDEKQFVYLHGYNVNTQQARGEHSSFFKRLYQMGLKYDFTGVTWFGWQSQKRTPPLVGPIKCPDYYENVINAFKTSPALVDELNSRGYENIVIGAHSLGNMVVSSSIVDWDLDVDKYLLFNAAVATEAYGESVTDVTRAKISPSNWAEVADAEGNGIDVGEESYHTKLWASDWFQLFSDGDWRSLMRWRGRFGSLDGKAINFHSTSENVLKDPDGSGFSLLSLDDIVGLWIGTSAWYAQEYGKGIWLSTATGDNYAGWDFTSNRGYMDFYTVGNGGDQWRPWPPAKANLLGPEELRALPFFEEFQEGDSTFALPLIPEESGFKFEGAELYGAEGESGIQELPEDSKELYMIRAKLLAEGIPAVSKATGANRIGPFGENSNFDMPSEFREVENGVAVWPEERDGEWHHGDIHRVAIAYLYTLYERVLEE